jgi:hypothetical protein
VSPRIERQRVEFMCFDQDLEPAIERGRVPGLSLVTPKRLLDVHEIELRPVPLYRLTLAGNAEEAQDEEADEEGRPQPHEAAENFAQRMSQ